MNLKPGSRIPDGKITPDDIDELTDEEKEEREDNRTAQRILNAEIYGRD